MKTRIFNVSLTLLLCLALIATMTPAFAVEEGAGAAADSAYAASADSVYGTSADSASDGQADEAAGLPSDDAGDTPSDETAGALSKDLSDTADAQAGDLAAAAADSENSLDAWTPEEGLPDLGGIVVTVLPGASQLLIQWENADIFDSYEVSYARNLLYLNDTTVTVEGSESHDLTLDGLDTSNRYYVRVRGCKSYYGDVYCTGWVCAKTSGSTAAASVKFVKKNKSKVDVRKMANGKLDGFTISQGCCSDGSNIYMCFEKRNGDDNGSGRARIKIAKVRISDWTLLKVSSSGQKLGHANDITYNPNQDVLVVTGAKTNDPYVRLVDPKTLKKTKAKIIKLTDPYAYVKAFNAIDYDVDSCTYYIRSRFYGGLCFTLDEKFRMVGDPAAMHTKFPSRSVQSCTSTGQTFILSQSWYQSSNKNTVTIFEKTGEMLQHIKLKLTGELESLFIIGNQLYATVHKHVKNGYTTGYIFRILL